MATIKVVFQKANGQASSLRIAQPADLLPLLGKLANVAIGPVMVGFPVNVSDRHAFGGAFAPANLAGRTRNGGNGKIARLVSVARACGVTVTPSKLPSGIDGEHAPNGETIMIFPASLIRGAASLLTVENPDYAVMDGLLKIAGWAFAHGVARQTMLTDGALDDNGDPIRYSMAKLAKRFNIKSAQNTRAINEAAINAGFYPIERANMLAMVPTSVKLPSVACPITGDIKERKGKARCLSQSLETGLRWLCCATDGEQQIILSEYTNDPAWIGVLTVIGRLCRRMGHRPSARDNTVNHFLG